MKSTPEMKENFLPDTEPSAAAASDTQLSLLAQNYRRQIQQYWPRFQTYARQGRQLGQRYNQAGRQLKNKFASGSWQLDQQSSLGLLILPIEAGMLISRHLLALLEDLLAVGEHRLGLKELEKGLADRPLPTLALKARPGEKIESVFLIQNDQPHQVTIELQPQSMVGQESGPCDSCEFGFSPQATTLEAGANQMVRLTTQVSEDAAEDIYQTRINILGMENKAFCIQLQVFL
ncbi:hypothetical protein BTA51_27360 [Hahella sp. CCB-MM4]|uniref:hypothetical protein n=1 Tax=Hahella sp. (strain CCB-MM4) TaxID=1926491 RepID=UPI000B9AB765|nr:hypothetical protein [Hahella sp. CCB-MM4]OZG70193.1 hypothetical protein BTA51_27360 [Hahella sp. CCB-MM4]